MGRLGILWAYLGARYNAGRFRDRTALERWQDERVRRLLGWVRERSPFYRDYWGGLRPEAWREAPAIDKSIMMDNFSRLNTRGVDRDQAMELALEAEESRDFVPTLGGVTVGLSSGTSGNRGLFLASPAERARWAGTILAKALPAGLIFGPRQRIAFFLRANSNLYTTVGSRKIRFEFFDLLKPFEEHVERLNGFQPTLLVAPPSMLRMLAAEQGRTLGIEPTRVISVAEVLDPLDRQHIAGAFGDPVHQIYQATEGLLGTTCAHGTLHLAEDGLVVQREYLDDDQTRFSPVITDFRRTSQPIVRYRLNDVLVLRTEPCPCGSVMTALDFVEGRADDLFYLPSEGGTEELKPVFPDFVRRAVISASGAIDAYGVRQVAADTLEVFLRLHPGASADRVREAAGQRLDAMWKRLGCRVPAVRFIDDWASGGMKKLKRIERSWTPPGVER